MMLRWSASPPAIDKLRMVAEPDVRIRFLYDDWSLKDEEAGSMARFYLTMKGSTGLSYNSSWRTMSLS